MKPSSTVQVDENSDRYPTVVIYWSIRKLALPVTALAALATFFGSVGFGFISGKGKLSPDIAILWFLFCVGALLLLIYFLIKWKITRPAIIIDKLGFLDRRYVSERIPWSCVAEISSTTRSSRPGTEFELLEVLLKAETPSSIKSQIESKKWLNFRNGLVITISDGLVAASYGQLYILFLMYFEKFGEMSKSAVGLSHQTDESSHI